MNAIGLTLIDVVFQVTLVALAAALLYASVARRADFSFDVFGRCANEADAAALVPEGGKMLDQIRLQVAELVKKGAYDEKEPACVQFVNAFLRASRIEREGSVVHWHSQVQMNLSDLIAAWATLEGIETDDGK